MPEPGPRDAVGRLAAWVARLDHAAVPKRVLDVARDCLVDTLGVGLAGGRTRVGGIARETMAALYGPGRATVLGGGRGTVAAGAAFANGAAAHALDFDDNSYAGFVHGSAVIVPAAFAVAECAGLSGARLLTALVAGAEVEYAVGKAATSSLYGKGWWTTGVLGPVGAAAATAFALGLDAGRTAAALGIAVAGTGGSKSAFGTDAKPLLCGRAAEAGVVAAMLAAGGASGPPAAFEDPRGFARLLNDGIWDPAPIAALGRTWSLLEPGIDVKRIPVCLSAHAAVDAVMALMAEHALSPAEIERIVCDVSAIVTANLVHAEPKTPQEAQFSLPFALACSLVHGDVRLEHLHPAVLEGEDLRRAIGRVDMVTSPRWAPGSDLLARHPEGAFIELSTTDGRRFETFGAYARGMQQRPLTRDEHDGKFLDCAAAVPGLDARALLDRLRDVDALPDVRVLFADTPLGRAADAR